jgi:hypothetical protein
MLAAASREHGALALGPGEQQRAEMNNPLASG